MPADSRVDHGFSNRGDAQDLSAVQLEQYVEVAEKLAFHLELLSVAERMQELFSDAYFRVPVVTAPLKARQQAILSVTSELGANNNVEKTAAGSDWSIDEFRQLIAKAYVEDRGGVYSVIGNENTTIAGKGDVLQLAFGEKGTHVLSVNPSEDLWNVTSQSAKASSGNAIFTNRVKDRKQLHFGFQKNTDQSWNGIVELGIVVISREGQSGIRTRKKLATLRTSLGMRQATPRRPKRILVMSLRNFLANQNHRPRAFSMWFRKMQNG